MPAPKATGILESRRLDILEALGTSDRSRNLNYKWLHLFHICIEIEVNDPASTACILDTRRLDIFEIKKYLEQLMDAITSMVANICLFQLFRKMEGMGNRKRNRSNRCSFSCLGRISEPSSILIICDTSYAPNWPHYSSKNWCLVEYAVADHVSRRHTRSLNSKTGQYHWAGEVNDRAPWASWHFMPDG